MQNNTSYIVLVGSEATFVCFEIQFSSSMFDHRRKNIFSAILKLEYIVCVSPMSKSGTFS